MTELRRSLRVMRREQDAFEPLADELVEVVLGMLDTKSLGRTACCNRRLRQLATDTRRDRDEKLGTFRSLVLECNSSGDDAPRAGFASIEEAILPAVSILRAETCGTRAAGLVPRAPLPQCSAAAPTEGTA